MLRTGECNLCGQCCGAEGSPNQANPWLPQWDEVTRNWHVDDLPLIMRLVGSPAFGAARHGQFRIGGHTVRFAWVEGVGLRKDLPPYGREPYSLECPFLLDDPGDGTRPCALYGVHDQTPLGLTPHEIWALVCEPAPPLEKDAGQLAQWQADHPLCSYVWA